MVWLCGALLANFFPNFFLGYLKQNYFTECNNVKPIHFMYVMLTIDTFVLFNMIKVILKSL